MEPFNALKTYYAVKINQRPSKSRVACYTPINLSETDLSESIHSAENLSFLWKEHQRGLEISRDITKSLLLNDTSKRADILNLSHELPSFSFMDLKIKIAEVIFRECILCPQKCRTDRTLEKGKCGVTEPRISSEFLHMGEEQPLVPSHTIFFSGCNMGCVYCQNYDISTNPQGGMFISPSDLACRIDQCRKEESYNVNFVGGDPTPNLLYVLRTLQLIRENIPVVWNSNMYLSSESMKLLNGFTDLYLTDFKYGNNKCALRLSGVKNYMQVVGCNHKIAQKAGDMIMRHLVLPGHVECCSIPLLEWIYDNLGPDMVLNIMGQYRPLYKAPTYQDISRPILPIEVGEVVGYAKDLGFRNIIN